MDLGFYIPFNSVNGDRKHSAYGIRKLLAALVADGVFPTPSGGFFVTAGTGLGIQVAAGTCMIKGSVGVNDAQSSFTLAAADASRTRYDRVVLRVDEAARKIMLDIKTGTPSTSPQAPALRRSADAWELSVARITVAAGAVTLSQSAITDERGSATVCGFAAAVTPLDTTSLFAQYDTTFREFMDTLTNVLSGDVAGNLLNLINGVSARTTALEGTVGALQSSLTADGNFLLNPHLLIWNMVGLDIVNPAHGAHIGNRWKVYNPTGTSLRFIKHSNEYGAGGGFVFQKNGTGSSDVGFMQTVETRYSELSGKTITVTAFTSNPSAFNAGLIITQNATIPMTRVNLDSTNVTFQVTVPSAITRYVTIVIAASGLAGGASVVVYGATGTVGTARMQLGAPNFSKDFLDCARYYLKVSGFVADCFYTSTLNGPVFPVPMYANPTVESLTVSIPAGTALTPVSGSWSITDQQVQFVSVQESVAPYQSGYYCNYTLSADL